MECLEVVCVLQRMGHCVTGLYEEIGGNWQIRMRAPITNYSSKAIVKEIQDLGYNVTSFDMRFSFVAINFQKCAPTNDFLHVTMDEGIVSTLYNSEDLFFCGMLRCSIVECE